jgi:hypothetical protein
MAQFSAQTDLRDVSLRDYQIIDEIIGRIIDEQQDNWQDNR